MIHYYCIDQGIQATENKEAANWLQLQSPSKGEVQAIIDKFQLPADIFIASERPDEVARLEHIDSLGPDRFYELVIFNINPKDSLPMEEQIQPISFIFSDKVLITCSNQDSDIMDVLLTNYQDQVTSIESFILYAILHIYRLFIEQLDILKSDIDVLDQNARKTMSAQELFTLADTERELVFIDHTLKDQALAMATLWKEEAFINRVQNPSLIYDVKLAQRHADKLVNIYRDLLQSIGGLFSDMMSHRLNLLMKFLNSAALILSIPTLISGIWGMNSQVPGEGTTEGFYLVVIIGAICTFLFALYLKHKDFTK